MILGYSRSHVRLASAAIVSILAAGCSGTLPGRPGPAPEVIPPDQVLTFSTLYNQNCSACHGTDGKGGAAIGLANPVYLAVADDDTIRRVTMKGVNGTQMSPFAHSEGGSLTDKQIDVLVHGMRSWAQTEQLGNVSGPPYAAGSLGDAKRGASVFATFCSGCHGPNGEGSKRASSIVNGTYLALVSDQGLRTIVIAGRPELGHPDWRND